MKDSNPRPVMTDYDPDSAHRGPLQIARRSLNLFNATINSQFVLKQGSKQINLLSTNIADIAIFVQECFMDHVKSEH